MTRLIDRIIRSQPVERSGTVQLVPSYRPSTERLVGSSRSAFILSPVVHAVVNARAKVFSEVDFSWRRYRDRDLFTDAGLAVLERPWPGATATELLARMEQDASLSGNAYVYRAAPNRLQRWHPNKTEIIHNGREVTGYMYWPDGIGNGKAFGAFPDEVAHWAPIPHPEYEWLGVAWIEAVLPEIRASLQMTAHQEQFYKNAATPNLFVKVEHQLSDTARSTLREELERRYAGVENAWKTMVLDGGADIKPVGADFVQMDYVNTASATEARVASAGGVPPIIIGLKAGLDAATYSNYNMAMRAFADHTIRPLWNSAMAALEPILQVPAGAQLWYDDSKVAALRQDQTQEADIRSKNAVTLRQLIDGGFTPESAVAAVAASDFTLLQHSGLLSVQLQEPGVSVPDQEPAA